ncbi:transcription antitermination factor NusB [Ezakiella peruensis]|uniref:transcription antitermination factor NusB n=1 Tax=Ezakiella peruensis TaxID=1464038 RepID=UPI000C1B5E7F|nr:transcription antitermination factor NusB [Ezakiella peruensis]
MRIENRKKHREEAIKILYAMEINNQFNTEFIDNYAINNNIEKDSMSYTYELLLEYLDNKDNIEDIINREEKNYKFNRIPLLDKCIVRLALVEIKYLDIPIGVAINEAVEISKIYSEVDSYKVVNSLLGKISRSMND